MAPEDRLKAKQQTNELGHASPRVRPTECCLQAPPDQPHAAGLSNAQHVYTRQASGRANPPTQPKAHQTATTSHVQRAARLFSSGRLRSRPQRGPKHGARAHEAAPERQGTPAREASNREQQGTTASSHQGPQTRHRRGPPAAHKRRAGGGENPPTLTCRRARRGELPPPLAGSPLRGRVSLSPKPDVGDAEHDDDADESDIDVDRWS